MGHHSNRREFLKSLGGSRYACLLRVAGALGVGFSSAFALPRDPLVLGADPISNQPVGVAKGLHPGASSGPAILPRPVGRGPVRTLVGKRSHQPDDC